MLDQDYKVSVYSSKLGIPLNFVVHTHIVTEHAGQQNRYDVFSPYSLAGVEPYEGIIYKIEKTRFFKKHEIIILPVNIKIAANNALVTLINFQYQVYKRQIILKS